MEMSNRWNTTVNRSEVEQVPYKLDHNLTFSGTDIVVFYVLRCVFVLVAIVFVGWLIKKRYVDKCRRKEAEEDDLNVWPRLPGVFSPGQLVLPLQRMLPGNSDKAAVKTRGMEASSPDNSLRPERLLPIDEEEGVYSALLGNGRGANAGLSQVGEPEGIPTMKRNGLPDSGPLDTVSEQTGPPSLKANLPVVGRTTPAGSPQRRDTLLHTTTDSQTSLPSLGSVVKLDVSLSSSKPSLESRISADPAAHPYSEANHDTDAVSGISSSSTDPSVALSLKSDGKPASDTDSGAEDL